MDLLKENLKKLLDWSIPVAGKLIVCAVLIIVGSRLIRLFVRRMRSGKALRRLKDPGLRTFLASALNVLLYVELLLLAAAILGLPMASFITLLASGGVAIGLAMQGALSNLAGGVMLLLFHPFRVGDYIETQGHSGFVTGISVFYTSLLTYDNNTVTLPNGTLTNAAVLNYSANGNRRVALQFDVSYEADIDTVKTTLLETALRHPLVLEDPAPQALLAENAESAMRYALRAWCRNEDYWTVYFELLEAGKKALDAAGITVPYPQVDVHIKQS